MRFWFPSLVFDLPSARDDSAPSFQSRGPVGADARLRLRRRGVRRRGDVRLAVRRDLVVDRVRRWRPPTRRLSVVPPPFAEVSFPFAPRTAAMPVVGAVLSVSAETTRLCALTGVAAVLSMNALENVVRTTIAMPAPDPASVESPFVVMFVLTLDLIFTAPVAPRIALVPESWLVPEA